MATLNWIGKDRVLAHHLDVPYRTLEPAYTFPTDAPSSENMLIHGDNLEALKALIPTFAGKVDLVYIDPPYNTGNEEWIYNDNVNDPIIRKWLGRVVGRQDLTRHDKWLCMMYPRLRLLRDLMKPNAMLFISIDDNEVAPLRMICDEIFGAKSFVEDYIWESNFRPDNSSSVERENAQHILAYAKDRNGGLKLRGAQKKSEGLPSLTKSKEPLRDLTFQPDWVDFKFASGSFSAGPVGTSYKLLTPLEVQNHRATAPFTLRGHMFWSQSGLEEQIQQGTRIVIKRPSLTPYSKKLQTKPLAPTTLLPRDQCADIQNARKELRAIFGEVPFNYPKPTALIDYLISMCVNLPNDAVILDSFAGSGTTAHAVLRHNSENETNYRFITVELLDYAEEITAERIRHVINNSSANTTSPSPSFTFYELGEPLFIDGLVNPTVPTKTLQEFIWLSETSESYTAPDTPLHTDFLGIHNNTSIFFHYDPKAATTLDRNYLTTIPVECAADHFIIYADMCAISSAELDRLNITFKKIPRDIRTI